MSYVEYGNGIRQYPEHRPPRKVPEGFVADPTRPHILYPRLSPCPKRKIKKKAPKRGCRCRKVDYFYCTELDREVTYEDCEACT